MKLFNESEYELELLFFHTLVPRFSLLCFC